MSRSRRRLDALIERLDAISDEDLEIAKPLAMLRLSLIALLGLAFMVLDDIETLLNDINEEYNERKNSEK